MGLRQSLRVATGALLLACGLQFAHANSDPHTIVFGVAPAVRRYGKTSHCPYVERERL